MEMFIADTHFGHENIIREHRSQFRSIDEMDALMLEKSIAK